MDSAEIIDIAHFAHTEEGMADVIYSLYKSGYCGLDEANEASYKLGVKGPDEYWT